MTIETNTIDPQFEEEGVEAQPTIPQDELVEIDHTNLMPEHDEINRKLLAINAAAPSVSTESFTQYFSGTKMMDMLGDFMASMTDMTTEMMNRVSEITSKALSNDRDLSRIEAYARQLNYFTINKKTDIFVPPHFSGNYLDYAKFLREAATLAVKVEEDFISPLSLYFAAIINKPKNLQSATFKPNYAYRDTELYEKRIQGFFKGPNRSKAKWGEVFARNEEVPEFTACLRESKDILRQCPAEQMKKSVESLSSRAKLLAQKFGDRSGAYVMAPAQKKYFSEVLYQAARSVEFYSVVTQLVIELEQAIYLSGDKFKLNG